MTEIIDKFSIIINPAEPLGVCSNGRTITELTGITQEQVDNGSYLSYAYEILKTMHIKHGSFINPITWGGGDSEHLKKELFKYSDLEESDWCFGRRWIDAKTLFVSWRLANNLPIQGGLAKSMTKLGLKFNGRKHDALADAENTFKIYRAMLSLLKGDTNE